MLHFVRRNCITILGAIYPNYKIIAPIGSTISGVDIEILLSIPISDFYLSSFVKLS